MGLLSAAAKIARYKKGLEDTLDDDPELQEALRDPELLREFARQPGSKLVGAGSRLVTGRALQMAWYGLIPSYGLTLFYLNFHFFVHHFAHRKGFTPLGSEWKIWRMVLGWPSFGLKYAELIALFFLDALAIMIILAIATVLAMVAYAIAHPCDFVGKIGYTTATTFAALGGPLAQMGVAACTAVNVVS